MNAGCETCKNAELVIDGNLLSDGHYSCKEGCDTETPLCMSYWPDMLNEDFQYSYAS